MNTVIVGVGGAGGSIAARAAELVRGHASVAAVNTDARALERCTVPAKVPIGADLTRGLGSGGDVGVGRQAAEADADLLRGLFADCSLAFVIAGLGGGTGTGAAPAVVAAAREAGALTLAFATLPFRFEGPARMTVASQGMRGLQEMADALVVVPNDRLAEAVGQGPVASVFEAADRVLAGGICAIWKMLVQPGLIALDFANLQKLVQDSGGACTFGYGEGAGPDKAAAALRDLLDGPMLDRGEALTSARSVIVSIVGGNDLSMKELHAVMSGISARLPAACQPSMGTSIDEEWTGRLTVTVLFSQLEVPQPKEFVAPVAEPMAAEDLPSAPAAPGAKRKRKAGDLQPGLPFEARGRGRFKDVEPTVLNGEDLDIPSFLRRGITVER